MKIKLQVARRAPTRVTLRLQSDLLESLMEEAQKKDLALNALINRTLNRITSYDNNVNVIQCITMPHELFLEIINQIPENSISEIGKGGPRIVKKLFNILGMKYDLEHVIENYFTILGKYCGWFEFSYKEQFRKYRLVFCIGKDPKWSMFVQAYVKNILDSLKIVPINDTIHDGIVVFEFALKDH
jgi:hypothetical protein